MIWPIFRAFVALSSSPRVFNFGLEQLKIDQYSIKKDLIQKFDILSKFWSNQAQILFSSHIPYTSFDTEPRFLDHHLNFLARDNAHGGFKNSNAASPKIRIFSIFMYYGVY